MKNYVTPISTTAGSSCKSGTSVKSGPATSGSEAPISVSGACSSPKIKSTRWLVVSSCSLLLAIFRDGNTYLNTKIPNLKEKHENIQDFGIFDINNLLSSIFYLLPQRTNWNGDSSCFRPRTCYQCQYSKSCLKLLKKNISKINNYKYSTGYQKVNLHF